MKILKTIITVIAISLTTVFSTAATEKNPESTKNSLRTELVSLLGNKIPLNVDKSYSAEISFIINNSKKINVKNIKKGEVYRMPIIINKK